ncbi:MAG: pyridoxal 5'-phosphate synthase glutaminase subunit PdxT [Candidatus Hadarchaeales archaeon]
MLKICVIGIQGAVSEHITAAREAMKKLGMKGEVIWAEDPHDFDGADGAIIPGGESTTIGKLMLKTGTFNVLQELGASGFPIMGTCAGMILLSKKGDESVERTGQPLLGLMDIEVIRNAFGRQRESFEADIEIPILGDEPFPCVFIRAPVIRKIWGDARVIAEFRGKIVGAEQKNMIAVAFHPELTADTRLHEYFLKKCVEQKR